LYWGGPAGAREIEIKGLGKGDSNRFSLHRGLLEEGGIEKERYLAQEMN